MMGKIGKKKNYAIRTPIQERKRLLEQYILHIFRLWYIRFKHQKSVAYFSFPRKG